MLPFARFGDALRRSVRLRLGLLLGAITVLALLAIASATWYLDASAGRGGAINLAGSLRMMGWRAALAAIDPGDGSSARFDVAVADLDRRIASPALIAALATDRAQSLHAGINEQWQARLRPVVRQAYFRLGNDLPPALREGLRAELMEFERLADALTFELERALESRLETLRMVQAMALFTLVGLVLAALRLIQVQLLTPLAALLEAARALRARRFDERVAIEGQDELGQLGEAFNAMAVELQAGYSGLEARVAEKTAALAQSNRQLALLYGVTRTLAGKPPDEQTLRDVLGQVCAALAARAALIRAPSEPASRDGFVVALTDAGAGSDLIASMRAGSAGARSADPGGRQAVVDEGGASFGIVEVPLRDGGERVGTLVVGFRPERRLEAWETSLLESIGQHVAAALVTARRLQDAQRIGLYRERSVIARELHDSLAQSLSFMKIQVARLRADLDAGRDPGRIVTELRAGLNDAYRQLRELLTTFRLQVGERGLGGSLEAAIEEFASRSGIEIVLDNRLPDAALSATEQIHVLQIVREALANVLRHARARRVDVRLAIDADRRVRVLVDDDGIGAGAGSDAQGAAGAREAAAAGDGQHHGLTIMYDRARTIGATLGIEVAPSGGTRVVLEFVAASSYAGHRDSTAV